MIVRNMLADIVQRLTAFREQRRSRSNRRDAYHPTATWIAAEPLENRELLTANSVTDWNEVLLDAIRAEKPAPPIASRAMAIVHTAIFDAVNSIDRRFEQFLVQVGGGKGASLDAAVAAAAQRTLAALFPAQRPVFVAALTASLAAVPNGPAETKGVQIGRAVADQILASRQNDGASAVVNYVPGNMPGDWRATPAGFLAAVLPQWPDVKPFALTSGSQFRPQAPPSVTSVEYAADFNAVKELGSATSATRTTEQTAIAKFWAGGPGTATPPGQWNMIAQTVAQNTGSTIAETARMFALLNIALADAAISSWDAKYEYNFWRPVTAIREANSDGNGATVQDAAWTPLLSTPAFPTYTSGHSTFSGAAATVLKNFLGTDSFSFVAQSESVGISNRTFTSFSQAAAQAGMSRIYGGIHYGFDNVHGLSSGGLIGDLVTDTLLRPVIRINAGGPALSQGSDFNSDRGFQNGVGLSDRTNAVIDMTAVPAGLPQQLFQTVLWDARGGRELQFRIPAKNGATYRVDLLFSEIWTGAFGVGKRVFDVKLDGILTLDNLDIFAEVGANKALMKSFAVVSDGELNIELLHGIQNPAIAGLVITELAAPSVQNTAPTITAIPDQFVNGGKTISIPLTVTDAENNPLTITASVSDPAMVTSVTVKGTGRNRTLLVTAGTALGASSITVTVNDGTTSVLETFTVTASLRLNAGGPQISGAPPYLSEKPFRNIGHNFSTSRPIDVSGVPAGIPAALFQTVLFDVVGGPEMQFNIPLQAGSHYRVDLLFSEIWRGAFGVGKRVFDVKLDGILKLDNFDIFAEAGANKGLVKSFNITSDGILDIDLFHGVQNPAIAGIQITRIQ